MTYVNSLKKVISYDNDSIKATTVADSIHNANAYKDAVNNISNLNVNRGGVNGNYGFTIENLTCAEENIVGGNYKVLDNNGIADIVSTDTAGHETYYQVKSGYETGTVDWDKYKGQKIIVDKDNKKLAEKAQKAGLETQYSKVSKAEAQAISKAQKVEAKITGKSNAPITGTAACAHKAGIAGAKFGAKVAAPMNLGANIYDAAVGNKSVEDAVVDSVVDGAKIVGSSYLASAGTTVALGAATAASNAIAGTALGTTIASATTAITSTAVGGAIATGAATVATGVGATLGAIAAAPALPVVVGAAILGGVIKGLSDWF